MGRLLVVVLCLACFVGCTTTQVLTRPQGLPPAAEQVKPGDKVVIELLDGRLIPTVVSSVSAEKLYTKAGEYAWQDIARIEVERVSGWRTFFLVTGVTLAILAAALLYAVTHMDLNFDMGPGR